MTDPAPAQIIAKGLRCRLKNRRVFVGRLPNGDIQMSFTRIRNKTDPPGKRTFASHLALSSEAMEALVHTYLSLKKHEDAEHAKKMPTTYMASITAVDDPTTWTAADHERGVG